MSIKTEVRGIVKSVSRVITTKSGFKMEIVIRQPATQNEFGETYGKDNFYKVVLYKKQQQDLPPASELMHKKIIANCYLNGNEYAGDKGLLHSLNLNIQNYSIV